MNAVKTGLMIFGLLAGTIVTAQEHDRGTPEERAQRRTERMAEELSLTDAQKVEMNGILLEAIKKHDEIRNNAKLTDEQRHEAMKAAHKAEKASIEALLTDGQKAALEKKHAEMKEKHRDFPEHGEHLKDASAADRATVKTQRMAETLKLTGDQKTKLADLNLRTEQKRDAIRSDAARSEEDRKAAMKELHRYHKEELSQILTKEQLEKLKEEKHAHCAGNGTKTE